MSTSILVYGSLRHKLGNHNYIKAHAQPYKPAEPLQISGYRLYLDKLYGLPVAKYTANEDDLLTVEQYNVDDQGLLSIDRLEGYKRYNPENSLYKRMKVAEGIKSFGKQPFIYIGNDLYFPSYELTPLPSGDIVQEIEERRTK